MSGASLRRNAAAFFLLRSISYSAPSTPNRTVSAAGPPGAVEAARCELATEFLAGLRRIDAQMRDAKNRLTMAVRASATTVTEVFGAGPSSPPR
jgi:hypothetical protein